MANAGFIRHAVSEPSNGLLVPQIAVTAFVGILALAGFAPGIVTAVIGGVLLAFGFLLASLLWLVRGRAARPSTAWDIAGVATFLGFVAILVSEAVPAL